MALYLSGDEIADQLLTEDPFALLIGMVLDQQIPLERAFAAPALLRERLGGTLDVTEVATMEPAKFTPLFSAKPPLQRSPAAMATRVQLLAARLVDQFGGDAARVWTDAT